MTNDDGRTVLRRTAAIMDAFDMGESVLSLKELSERTSLPKSTVHRLVEQLRALGWIEREHDSRYRVGMRLFELGGLALQRNQLRDSAFPHLHALAAQTGLAVQLGVLDRGEVVYLERIVTNDFAIPTRLGGRMPAYCTGLGKAMLAFDAAVATEVAAAELPQRTAATITDGAQLHDHLDEVRSVGVARDVREAYEGLVCVAAPIRNSGRAIGAVSVTAPLAMMDWEAMTHAVRTTASNIWNARFPSNGGAGPRRCQTAPAHSAPADRVD